MLQITDQTISSVQFICTPCIECIHAAVLLWLASILSQTAVKIVTITTIHLPISSTSQTETLYP
jgi:hypothetical protein